VSSSVRTTPAAPGDRVTIVAALPGELDAGAPVPEHLATIQLTLHSDEREPSGAASIEVDEPGPNQVDLTPSR
jgi:hypothetical protein